MLFLIRSNCSYPADLGFRKSAVRGYLTGYTTLQKVVEEAIGTRRRSMGRKPSARQSDAPEVVAAGLTARLAQHGALLWRLTAAYGLGVHCSWRSLELTHLPFCQIPFCGGDPPAG